MEPGPVAANMPAAEVDIDVELVRRLLGEQHPDLAALTITELTNGWDNVMFRLGSELTVRIPRRAQAAALIEHEQRWLPVIGPALSLPVPIPVRLGQPTDYYPWAWSVLPWFAGTAVGLHTPEGRQADEMAVALGRFLAGLHRPAAIDAPINEGRGCALEYRDEMTRSRIEQLADHVDAAATLQRWQSCLAAPIWDGPPMWLHGDLHPFNLVMSGGVLQAVVDFGDITGGDPATDLAVAFSLLRPESRDTLRAAAHSEVRPIDDAMWTRAEGWALSVGAAIAANSADNPPMSALGLRMMTAD